MIYKAIPGPTIINIDKGNFQSATNHFADIINRECQNGWSYHSMETITTEEQKGCFLKPEVVSTRIYMLIFCREQ